MCISIFHRVLYRCKHVFCRQSGNDQAASGLNNHVQMGSANPFATTVNNPWLGINHMLLGSKNMVIQPQVNETVPAHSAPANMQLPDGDRKRPRESSITNEAINLHNLYFPVPNFAPPQIRDEMISLRESDRLLCQQVSSIFMDYQYILINCFPVLLVL